MNYLHTYLNLRILLTDWSKIFQTMFTFDFVLFYFSEPNYVLYIIS